MGNYNRDNYQIVIKVRDNITDPFYLDYCIRTDMAFSLKEYRQFEYEHPSSFHPLVDSVMNFLCSYSNGCMKPHKWGYGFPLKRLFCDDVKPQLISNLTRPGGQVSILRKRCYTADFENQMYVPMWEDKIPFKMSERKRALPEYMFIMKFIFSKTLNNYPFLVKFVKDFCEYLSTDYGVIIDQSTDNPLFEYRNTSQSER